jgi:hypothetical protein
MSGPSPLPSKLRQTLGKKKLVIDHKSLESDIPKKLSGFIPGIYPERSSALRACKVARGFDEHHSRGAFCAGDVPVLLMYFGLVGYGSYKPTPLVAGLH